MKNYTYATTITKQQGQQTKRDQLDLLEELLFQKYSRLWGKSGKDSEGKSASSIIKVVEVTTHLMNQNTPLKNWAKVYHKCITAIMLYAAEKLALTTKIDECSKSKQLQNAQVNGRDQVVRQGFQC